MQNRSCNFEPSVAELPLKPEIPFLESKSPISFLDCLQAGAAYD